MTVAPFESGDASQEAGVVAQKIQSLMRRIVDDGVGPLAGSTTHADERLTRARSDGRTEEEAREVAIDRIINESIAKAGLTGFTTGLGGLVTMPISVPAGISGNFMLGLGKQVAQRAVMPGAWLSIRAIPGYLVNGVGVRAGYLLIVRYGTSKGAALLYKSLPLIGGVVSGALDGTFTKAVGAAAKKAFV